MQAFLGAIGMPMKGNSRPDVSGEVGSVPKIGEFRFGHSHFSMLSRRIGHAGHLDPQNSVELFRRVPAIALQQQGVTAIHADKSRREASSF